MPMSQAGSIRSVYSTASTARSTRTLGTSRGGHSTLKSRKIEWYQKPFVKNAFYTDLTTGAWHVTFYTLFLSIWACFQGCFEMYLLEEASPGSSHTGFYLFSFDFVYVGNHHVRNILFMSALFTMIGSLAVFISSCYTLDALRLEKETKFVGWLVSMGIFTPWRVAAWVYAFIVNDMIFAYHIIMFFVWLVFNVLDIMAWMVMYSLYLELEGISKLEEAHKFKVDFSSRAGSLYGSRPTSPYGGGTLTRAQAYNDRDLYATTRDIKTGSGLQSQPSNASSYNPYSSTAIPMNTAPQPQRREQYSSEIY